MLTIFLVLLTASFLLPSLYGSPQRPSGPKRGRQIGAPSAPDEDGGLIGICFLPTLAESSISSQADHRDRAAEPHHSDNGSERDLHEDARDGGPCTRCNSVVRSAAVVRNSRCIRRHQSSGSRKERFFGGG